MITFKQFIKEADEEFDFKKFSSDCSTFLHKSNGNMIFHGSEAEFNGNTFSDWIMSKGSPA